MNSTSDYQSRSPAAGLGLLAVTGFTAGLLLELVTALVERAEIEGQGWSLRGNGALVVPACGLPILLILGLLLLTRWLQADRPSSLIGTGTGLLALLVALFSSATFSQALLPVILLVAFAIALLLALRSGHRSIGWLMLGALALPLAVYAGMLFGTSAILPV